MRLEHHLKAKGLRLKNDLFRLCLLDKQMSGDEQRLVNSVYSNISELDQYLDHLPNELLTVIEKHNVELYIDKIEKDCLLIANEDKVVTLDERAILIHIKKAVLEMKEIVNGVDTA